MFFGPFIIPVVAIVACALVIISRGPLGQALAQRVAGRSHPPDADTEALRGELEGVVDWSGKARIGRGLTEAPARPQQQPARPPGKHYRAVQSCTRANGRRYPATINQGA